MELAKNLGAYASEHQATGHDIAPQQALSDAVRDLGHGANDEKEGSNGGQPIIALSAPGGHAAATPSSITLSAGTHIDSVAEQNQQITAGQKVVVNAGTDLSLFAQGGDLRHIAHQGQLLLQAQKNSIRLQADQSVELSASSGHIFATAEKHITLLCGGAYFKMAVRDYDPNAENLRVQPGRMAEMLNNMVNEERSPAGMHWHQIRQLEPGAICNDTPEGVVEYLFRLFEANPDMPASLVYSVEGYNIARALGQRGTNPIGVGTGPRQPGELTDAVVALIVARPERLDWLRPYAPYTQANRKNAIDPTVTGWRRPPPHAFQPTPSFPTPITARGLQQWDAMTVLAKLHRPVDVSLLQDAETKKPLKGEARHGALAGAWQKAIAGATEAPARVFFDTGRPIGGLVDLAPALMAARSTLDPLDSTQSYDLTQRLGDTGASSPFAGIALATMASYLNADTSVVMPLRRDDVATVITITSATPGQKPELDPFGVKLRPQNSSISEAPSSEHTKYFATLMQQSQRSQSAPARYIDPEKVALEQHLLDKFIDDGPSFDLSDLTKK